MSEEPMNGATTPVPQLKGGPGKLLSADQAGMMLENLLGPAMTLTIKGVQSSFPGFPAHLIMLAACRVLGKMCGITYAGVNAPLAPLMTQRKECREMFDKSMNEVPFNFVGGGTGGFGGPLPPPPGTSKS